MLGEQPAGVGGEGGQRDHGREDDVAEFCLDVVPGVFVHVERGYRSELAERLTAMHAYDQAGRHEHASRLREEIGVLSRYVEGCLEHDADHD